MTIADTPDSPPKTVTENDRSPFMASVAELARELGTWNLVAFVGLLTFVTTLASEYGRAACWDFPVELVHFSKENALSTFIQIIIGGFFFVMIIQMALLSKLFRYCVSFFFVSAMVIGSWRIAHQWGAFGVMAAFGGAGYVIWALSLIGQPTTAEENRLTKLLVEAVGKPGIALTTVMIVMPYAAFAFGFFAAANQERFVVTTSKPNRIVLATYGSQAVCATLNADGDRRWISKSFELLDLSSDKVGGVTTEHLGLVQVRDR